MVCIGHWLACCQQPDYKQARTATNITSSFRNSFTTLDEHHLSNHHSSVSLQPQHQAVLEYTFTLRLVYASIFFHALAKV